MEACPQELNSQHCDKNKSKGIIKNDEILIFVVLNDKHVDDDGRLNVKAFPSDRLAKEEASIARLAHTPEDDLRSSVIDPALARGLVFHGVATISAQSVREIEFESPDKSKSGKALCAIDKVESTDADGHGILIYSSAILAVTGNVNAVGRMKARARADLAEDFSTVMPLSALYPTAANNPPKPAIPDGPAPHS